MPSSLSVSQCTRSRLTYTVLTLGVPNLYNCLVQIPLFRISAASAPFSLFIAVYQVLPNPNSFLTWSWLTYTGQPSGYRFCSNALFRSLCIRLPATPLPLYIVVCQVQFFPIKFYYRYPVLALLHWSTLRVSFLIKCLVQLHTYLVLRQHGFLPSAVGHISHR